MSALICSGPVQDMEKNVKEFAAGVEQLVDRIVSGELGVDLAQNADKYVSGFLRMGTASLSRQSGQDS